LFIARASENAVPAEWLMGQPIFIRKKYLEAFKKEVKERESKLNQAAKNRGWDDVSSYPLVLMKR